MKPLLFVFMLFALASCSDGYIRPTEVCIEKVETGRVLYSRSIGDYKETVCTRSEYRCPAPLTLDHLPGNKGVYCRLERMNNE